MIQGFINIRILDIIDIIAVAIILYQFYSLIKGTTAINIFIGIFSVWILWRVVRALDMQLLGSIMGQIIGVGVIAIMIVFQQEIRRFLLIIGTRYIKGDRFSLENLIPNNLKSNLSKSNFAVEAIHTACKNMSQNKIGALIAIAKKSDLTMFYNSGEVIDANCTSNLLESIFFKNNPLHDGGIIIKQDKINAARCIFPLSENQNVPNYFGLRHRAALGLSESTDACIIVISEETGRIAYAKSGLIKTKVTSEELHEILSRDLKE